MTAPRTLNELFFGCIDRFVQRPVAVRFRQGEVWQDISHDANDVLSMSNRQRRGAIQADARKRPGQGEFDSSQPNERASAAPTDARQ